MGWQAKFEEALHSVRELIEAVRELTAELRAKRERV
jgi:hypothetical protein